MFRKAAGLSYGEERKVIKEVLAGIRPEQSGLSRRRFLQVTGASAVLISCIGPKPVFATPHPPVSTANQTFNEEQRAVLSVVQLILFPDDGDGPSAKDLNALNYLDWALNEPDNSADGDRAFIIKGIGWLSQSSKEKKRSDFLSLSPNEQEALITSIAQSSAGRNWLALLLYYILESLTLDPIYGGNPNGVGWSWLEHQPGFPQPISGKTYLDFL